MYYGPTKGSTIHEEMSEISPERMSGVLEKSKTLPENMAQKHYEQKEQEAS